MMMINDNVFRIAKVIVRASQNLHVDTGCIPLKCSLIHKDAPNNDEEYEILFLVPKGIRSPYINIVQTKLG